MLWTPSDKEYHNQDFRQTEDDNLLEDRSRAPCDECVVSKRSINMLSITSYILLISIVIIQIIIIIHLRTSIAELPPSTGLLALPTTKSLPRTSGLFNKFWRGDELESTNEAWDAINSGHGAIVVTPQFKEKNGLPDTIRHPHDQSVYAYALEAYHMIHCIQVLRKDFLLIRDGKPATKPLEHTLHCFDALRQSVMCQANDELLIITGTGHANGFNQTRQCRSWDALRDFATANTACYWDDELPEGVESRWAMCDGGYDGLPVGAILE